MTLAKKLPWCYLAALLVANLALLLPEATPLRVAGALLLIDLLPGLSWANWLLASSTPLLRWVIAAAFSYTLAMLATLWLHYLPGPVQTWQLLAILDTLALIPILRYNKSGYAKSTLTRPNLLPPILVLTLFLALFLRGANLHYSEFQGDEALVMITAAEALEGHEDALFLRSKGPGEVLLPLALWRLTGTINELGARLPFTLAAMLAIVTIYLIGQELGGQRVSWLAAGFFAFNGFAVAFGRIVQYQALVLWMSALAFLLICHWRQTQQYRFAILGGLCLGIGLLAHYDAILVIPAIIWLFISGPTTTDHQPLAAETKPRILVHGYNFWSNINHQRATSLKSGLLFLATFLLTALTFYLPYALDPRTNHTGEYVGGRIGNELRNNLPNFFHFNAFYSSSYYIILTSLLVFGLLIWLVRQSRGGRWWVSILLAVGVIAVIAKPGLLSWDTLNLSILPFALLLAGAFFTLPFGSYGQALVLWLAAPFLGYNFVVALGLTHIYTIIPAWSLLAAVAWYTFFDIPHPRWRWLNHTSNYLLAVLLVLSTIFLWNAFVRHDREYWQDYPDGNLPLFWDPYQELPRAGFFGFAHRTGWKAVGQKIITGQLIGDYGSNEEPDVTTWYTRGAPRACDPQPEFYFLADDLIDPVDIPAEIIETNYQNIGRVTLPNQKQMRILQQTPATLALGDLDEKSLAREFDQTATPDAFARSARGAVALDVNFSNLANLTGYSVDPRRAYPGGRLPVTLYWQALAPIPASYQVFAHLEGDAGPVAQADGVPACWTYPTNLWQPGQIIADQHAISIPPDLIPGKYPLEVGLYLADSLVRLDVLDSNGHPAGTSVTLTMIEIGPNP
ncbi:MAG: glycosyltransferase family 39 protein [Anaerolineae bacterium]|nr:glycosyltransferase family 39 protein [Anaerolineae bacterium]